MPVVVLSSEDTIRVNFPLFDNDLELTGLFFNYEILTTVKTFALEYSTLLRNIKLKHCYLIKITAKSTEKKQEPHYRLVVASNLDDLSIYVHDLKEKYSNVEVRQVTGFKTEPIQIRSKKYLREKGLVPQS